jgi:quinol monooxygenase YgiN
VYDGFAPIQAEHGVHGHQVLPSIENPNDVIVTHTFDSPEAASAFFATPELKEAMSKGVSMPTLLRLPTLTRSKPARWLASR